MKNTTKLINLTLEDIMSLIKERNVEKDNIVISSNSSFLSVLNMLEKEMIKIMTYAKSSNT